MLRIVNHRLADATFRAAQSAGGKLRNPTLVVVHDTAGSLRPLSSVQWFESPECTTSAHVVIERDGTITQLVPFDMVAYHAGRSSWKGKPSVNAFSIGIEIVNPGMMVKKGAEAQLIYKSTNSAGRIVERVVERFPLGDCEEVDTPEHGKGWCLPYTPKQVEAVQQLCQALAAAYPSIEEIVTHWQVSPGRKVDTCPLFPLDALRAAVFDGAGTVTVADAPPVPDTAPPPANAGVLGTMSFSKVNQLADEGSRIATKIAQFKRWLWGSGVATATAAGSIDTNSGTGAAIKSLVSEHPFLVLAGVIAIVGAAAWVGLKLIERYLLTAANEGRYTTRGKP